MNSSKYGFQDNIDNLLNRIKNVENEKSILRSNFMKKEEYYKEELENLEKIFKDYKENQSTKFNSQCEENLKKKKPI